MSVASRPSSSRSPARISEYPYLSIGAHHHHERYDGRTVNAGVRDMQVSISQSEEKSGEAIGDGYIKRIAEEISYINVPAGDIPNVQIDGYMENATEGIPIKDKLKISFHSMSLPTATLIWHIPFISIFNSPGGKVNSDKYREFALIRIDGEYWESDVAASNEILVNKTNAFAGWEDWKARNKNGIDCQVTFTRKGNTITTITENMGISIKNVTTIKDDTQDIYVSLSGDQVALTNIKIR